MTDNTLLEVTAELFASFEPGGDPCEWQGAMWKAAAEMGLPWVGVPEEAGGQGGSIADALAVLKLAGAHAVPLPLAETGLLAGRLLAAAGADVPTEPTTCVTSGKAEELVLRDGRLHGVAQQVPWARSASRLVVLLPVDGTWQTVSVPLGSARITALTNLAGEPRDTVAFDGAIPELIAEAGVDGEDLLHMGALTRAVLMAGALERVCELTVRYTEERRQFGRALARFQAVQHHVVDLVQTTASVGLAAESAVRRRLGGSARFEIAAAKLLASQSVHPAVRAAHQAHGAMGVTQEYPLHRFTRRLLAWRTEYGDERQWAARLGTAAAEVGADGLYPLIASGSHN